ncbi:hypothetical protein, partial [Yersinia pseudotuberculosis]
AHRDALACCLAATPMTLSNPLLGVATVLAALIYPNHLLVVDFKMNQLIGMRSLAALLQRQ